MTPPHYAGPVTPWDLQKCMTTSGNLFVDARRTDAIEYCFRMKGDLLGDLVKARDNIDAAIAELEKTTATEKTASPWPRVRLIETGSKFQDSRPYTSVPWFGDIECPGCQRAGVVGFPSTFFSPTIYKCPGKCGTAWIQGATAQLIRYTD